MPTIFDLHMHTSRHSPDSVINPFSLMHRARDLKLDGIVITEHDFLWTEGELGELRAAVPQVMVFGGVEVSAKEGHFLCYGVTDPLRLPMGIGVAELCREVHRQGGAVHQGLFVALRARRTGREPWQHGQRSCGQKDTDHFASPSTTGRSGARFGSCILPQPEVKEEMR